MTCKKTFAKLALGARRTSSREKRRESRVEMQLIMTGTDGQTETSLTRVHSHCYCEFWASERTNVRSFVHNQRPENVRAALGWS